MDCRDLNVLALAFMGDAVYEQFIRDRVVRGGEHNLSRADEMHRAAVRYVCAPAQAKAVKQMIVDGFLSEEEEALVKRARNHRTATKPKNAGAVEYKWATALEALIGFLYLDGRGERLRQVMERTVQEI